MQRRRSSVLLVLSLALWGCTVRFVSRYDEVIDREVTELQKKVDSFLTRMESAASDSERQYPPNRSFYDETQIAVRAIRLRAESIPKNEITVQQLDRLSKSIDDLRMLHELSGPQAFTPDKVNAARVAMTAHFKAILTFELAKRRGER